MYELKHKKIKLFCPGKKEEFYFTVDYINIDNNKKLYAPFNGCDHYASFPDCPDCVKKVNEQLIKASCEAPQ